MSSKSEFDLQLHLSMVEQFFKENYTIVYTDGSCWHGDQIGGYGICMLSQDIDTTISMGPFQDTTVSIMEITAILHTLQLTPRDRKLVIYSDSEYAVKSLNIWIETWVLKDRPNGALFQQVLDVLEEFESEPIIDWVPGHADIDGNETADILASQARKRGR